MKILLYTFILLMTISGELFHLAYVLSFEHENIELIHDIKGENETEEQKDLGEDASEIPSSNINLNLSANSQIQLSNKSLLFKDDQFSRIATPPPDYS